MIELLLVIPVITAVLCFFMNGRRAIEIVSTVGAGILFIAVLLFVYEVVVEGAIYEGALFMDSLSAYMLLIVAFMVFIGGVLSAFALFQVPGMPDQVLLLLFCTGIVAGVFFFVRNGRSKNPLIRTELLRNRNFTLGILACLIITALFSGVTYLMPLYLVNSRHLDTFLAGMIMTVPAVLSMVIAPYAGSLSDRYGSPLVSAGAIGLSAIGFIFFFTFNLQKAGYCERLVKHFDDHGGGGSAAYVWKVRLPMTPVSSGPCKSASGPP